MGRQLKSISNGTNTYSYTYNEDGIRTSKTVGGVTTKFIYDNALLKAQYTDDYSMLFWYDENSSPIGFVYTDKTVSNPTTQAYIYTKNAQGDITGILNSSGTQVVNYTYDSWGNVLSITGSLSSTIGTINPIRYRGYYFDNETGYYYLQSRYYNPEWYRFINADDSRCVGASGNFLGINAYSYCENKPVNSIDENGKWLARVIGAVTVGAIFATLAHVVLKVVNAILKSVGCTPLNKKITTLITVGIGALGAVIGAIIGPSFLVKHAPRLLKAINQIEKQKFSIKLIKPNSGGNLFGINISNTLMLMLHYPHAGKDEWNFHFQVEWRTPVGKNLLICKKKIFGVSQKQWQKWRKYFGNK